MERSWVPATGVELEREMAEAIERGRVANETEPRAAHAHYDRRTGRVEVELMNGCFFAFPTESVQGLRGAPPELLSRVEVWADGYALRWEELDADFTVPGLMAGRFGTKAWMREHAGGAGSAKGETKTRAARRTGSRRGRPRTTGE